MTDLEKTTKAIFVLTEKIDLLERDLSLAKYYFEQAKKKCEEDDEKIERLEKDLSSALTELAQYKNKMHAVRVPNIHKETRPAAEKAEEIR